MVASTRSLRRAAAGNPHFRTPLLVLALGLFVLYGADMLAAFAAPHLPFDVPLTRAIQSVAWGPALPLFGAVDWFEGIKQIVGGGIAILVVLAIRARAVPLMIVGALSGGAYTLSEMLVHRARPSAGLVHVIRHTSNFSFPSGHVLFFTWVCALLILVIASRHVPRAIIAVLWGLSVMIVLAVGVGRVYEGEHWPSDVIGGFLLGAGWTSLALSIRWLSDCVLGGDRRTAVSPT